jgi:uncharacterized membrane protein
MPTVQTILALVVVLLWGGLALRVLLKLPRAKRWGVASMYLGAPVVALLGDAFASPDTALGVQGLIALVGVSIWLGSWFKPELMIDPKEVYDEEQITELIKKQAGRRQIGVMCVAVALAGGVYLAVKVLGAPTT